MLEHAHELCAFELGHKLVKELIIFGLLFFFVFGAARKLFGGIFSHFFAHEINWPFLLLKEADGCHWLLFEEIVDFELGPHEIDLKASLIHYVPPETAPNQLLHQWTVVSPSDPCLQPPLSKSPHLFRLLHVVVIPITPIHFEKKLSIGENPRLVYGIGVFRVDWLD